MYVCEDLLPQVWQDNGGDEEHNPCGWKGACCTHMTHPATGTPCLNMGDYDYEGEYYDGSHAACALYSEGNTSRYIWWPWWEGPCVGCGGKSCNVVCCAPDCDGDGIPDSDDDDCPDGCIVTNLWDCITFCRSSICGNPGWEWEDWGHTCESIGCSMGACCQSYNNDPPCERDCEHMREWACDVGDPGNWIGYYMGDGSECVPSPYICCGSRESRSTEPSNGERDCPQECIDAGCKCNCLNTRNGIVCL